MRHVVQNDGLRHLGAHDHVARKSERVARIVADIHADCGRRSYRLAIDDRPRRTNGAGTRPAGADGGNRVRERGDVGTIGRRAVTERIIGDNRNARDVGRLANHDPATARPGATYLRIGPALFAPEFT